MKASNSRSNDPVNKFWDKYIDYIINQGVKKSATRWYVIRVEQYINANSDKKLAQHSPNEVKKFLTTLGLISQLEDWQFCQTVDAIRNLFAMLNVTWLSEVDWQYWLDSSRLLAENHATIAKKIHAENTIEKLANIVHSNLSPVRQTHKAVLTQLLIEIRSRGYSVKTEQAYESWVARFILFNNNQAPDSLSSEHIISYLQFLAVRKNVTASTQNQALNALVFFYKNVLKMDLGDFGPFVKARTERSCRSSS